jgi:hypothetical protein
VGAFRVSEGGEQMSEHEQEVENGEEQIDDQGRNATQQEIDGDREGPAGGFDEPNDEPAQGEGGQEIV